jgi:hypothetical protein
MKNTLNMLVAVVVVGLAVGCASNKGNQNCHNYQSCPKIEDSAKFDLVNDDVLGEKEVQTYSTKEVLVNKGESFVYFKNGVLTTNTYNVPVTQNVTVTNSYKVPVVKSRTSSWEDSYGRKISITY